MINVSVLPPHGLIQRTDVILLEEEEEEEEE